MTRIVTNYKFSLGNNKRCFFRIRRKRTQVKTSLIPRVLFLQEIVPQENHKHNDE